MKNLLIFLSAIAAMMLSQDKSVQEQYIERYAPVAIYEMERTGVPACITLAQGIVESGSGTSYLSKQSNNHFGIKCHGWKGRSVTHTDDHPNECFRAYDTPEESFKDHSDFLRYYDRYKFLFSYDPNDYKAWSYGLMKAGYATSQTYANSLITVIERYDLCKYNSRAALDSIPTPPLLMEEAEVAVCPKPDNSGKVSPNEIVNISLSRQIYKKNGVKFVYALFGDTYKSISDDLSISMLMLPVFNDISKAEWKKLKDEYLVPGTMVFLEPKKDRTERGLEMYIVGEEEETLRDICQRFGVKMASVVKRNNLAADYVPGEGDELLLR